MENHFIEKIFNSVEIKKNSILLFSSDITSILIYFKRNRIRFNPYLIIEHLKEKIGPEGTLVIPSYNWEFCKEKSFDYKNTKSICGSLSNLCLEDKEFRRTKNPIYSFLVYGKYKNVLCNYEHKNCFDHNSPFGFLIEKQSKLLVLGLDYKNTYTLVHTAEQEVGVDYRYFKNFTGDYVDEHNNILKKEFTMYVRNYHKAKSTIIDQKLDAELKKNYAYQNSCIENVPVSLIDINKTHQIIIEDLKSKKEFVYPEF